MTVLLLLIMLQCDKNSLHSLMISDIDALVYFPIPDQEVWRIDLIRELLDTRLDIIDVPGFSSEEITDIINFACVS